MAIINKKIPENKEFYETNYTFKKKSIKSIAEELGVSCSAIGTRVKKFNLSRTHSESKKGINLSEKNSQWRGDNVGYKALHAWVNRHKPKPLLCENCNNSPYDLANISQKYKRDLNDWEWLCRSCHMIKDQRSKKYWDTIKIKNPEKYKKRIEYLKKIKIKN